MKKIMFWGLLALIITGQAGAVKQLAVVKYSQKSEMESILANPKLDIVRVKPGRGVECLADDSEIASLRKQGYLIDVLNADIIAHYRKIKANYKSNTFGPYYTYAEALAEMNNLHTQYPTLVSAPESLGAGWEHHAVWAFKVSNSPNADNGKPGTLFTGVHHAREPIGATINLGLARYFCQHYGTDPAIKLLLDNRQIWFIPIVNPDGYVYNQTYTDSLWRKNRRNNGTSYGVDVNRNYPFGWGYDNTGSSPTPSSETYRGPSAGSEPEIQAVMSLMNREGYLKTAVNYHSYGNDWIYPWGYIPDAVPDSMVYRDLGNEVTGLNGYLFGTSTGTVGYTTNGDSDDWMYGEELEKPRCFAFTPEVGEDFWQADTNGIVQQFNENLMPSILTVQAAGVYPAPTGKTLMAGGDGDSLAEPGELLDLSIQVKNRAVDAVAASVAGHIASSDPYIEIKQASRSYGDFDPRESKYETVPFVIAIDSACPASHRADFDINLLDDQGTVYPGSFSLNMTGRIDTIFSDEVESGAGSWTHGGSEDLWHITAHSSHTPSNSWYCGNEGTWQYNEDMNCRLVSGALTAKRYYSLSFWHRYGLETDWDYSYVEVSTDNGATWTQAGPRFNGTAGWARQTIDLSAYTGTIKLGFRLNSDSYVNDEGWYLDDILVTGDTSGNLPPDQPAAVSPVGGTIIPDSLPWLTVANATDPNGDALTYGFKIYSDSLLTDIYAQAVNVDSGTGQTGWRPNVALVPGHYWWRAFADDGKERGLFSAKADFIYEPAGVEGGLPVPALPQTYAMGWFSPNPSSGRTVVKCQLPQAGRVDLKIYNIAGQVIRTLVSADKPAGYHSIGWDGRDEMGQRVSSGLYFYRLQTPGFSATKKITVIR